MKRQAADAANATKLRATAAAAKKHKAESASKRYDDAMAIQEAYIQAKRESYPLTVLPAEPAPRFAPNLSLIAYRLVFPESSLHAPNGGLA